MVIKMKRTYGFLLFLALFVFVFSTKTFSQTAYAEYENNTLTFKYGTKPDNYSSWDVSNTSSTAPYWTKNSYPNLIQRVVFDESFSSARPTSCHSWFQNLSKITQIEGLTNFNTSEVTDMAYMFSGCSSIQSLNLANFDTGNVTTMQSMFSGCIKLQALTISSFNTSNVTNMWDMFFNCKKLSSLDVSGFNTQNVQLFTGMFKQCEALTELNVSGFNTESATTFYGMFQGCSLLNSLDVSGFITNNVTSMSAMFYGCSNLTSLNVSNFNTTNVTITSGMFGECTNLTTLDVSGFDTGNVTDMGNMFGGCSNLGTIDVSKFNTSEVTSMNDMFYNCHSVTNLEVSRFNTSKVINMDRMFYHCDNITTLNVNKFNIDKVTSMQGMFEYCEKLTTIYCNNDWGRLSESKSGAMFVGCTNLQGAISYDIDKHYAAYANPTTGYFTSLGNDELTISSTNICTYSSTYDLDFTNVEGLTAYVISDFNAGEGTLTLTPATTVKAGEGLLLKGDAGEYVIPRTTTEASYTNYLVGVPTTTSVSPTDGDYTNFILANGSHGINFYVLSKTGNIAAGKAYLQLPTAALNQMSLSKGFSIIDGLTSITNVEIEKNNSKIFYDLRGRRVEKPTKGLYIVNGKKVIIK